MKKIEKNFNYRIPVQIPGTVSRTLKGKIRLKSLEMILESEVRLTKADCSLLSKSVEEWLESRASKKEENLPPAQGLKLSRPHHRQDPKSPLITPPSSSR